jgi:hypothetical protein
MLDEERQVVESVPQRRDPEHGPAQRVVEVRPEAPRADGGEQVSVGRDDEPDTRSGRAVGQFRGEPSHPRLDVEREVGDLVEQQGAAAQFSQQIGAEECLSKGAGRTGSVPTSTEVVRESGAGEALECTGPAPAQSVKRSSHQVLARAGLPEDEDGHVVRRDQSDPVEQRPYHPALADQSLEPRQCLHIPSPGQRALRGARLQPLRLEHRGCHELGVCGTQCHRRDFPRVGPLA